MTITYNNLFSAILAMDAYQQGDDGALKRGLLGNQGGVGDATLVTNKPDPAHGFFAQAYSYNGQTVISYRGTTFNNGGPASLVPPAHLLTHDSFWSGHKRVLS